MKPSVSAAIKYVSVLLILLTNNVYGQHKSYFYYNFPPLYNFDDYDACLDSKHETFPPTYCMVYAEIKPNNSSELLQQMIMHYEEFPFRYKRDRLFFGVCVERCRTAANTTYLPLSGEDDVIHNEITDYFGKVHKRPLDLHIRSEYHAQIHNCLNFEFQQKYNLNLKTYIEYCEQDESVTQETESQDNPANLFYKIIGMILVLNVLSTLYDFHLKLQQPEDKQTNDFYKINPTTTVPKLLTSFSICRNYYRLMQPYHDDVSKDFQFLDCYRTITMIFAVFGHIHFAQFQHISNPEFFEYSEKNKNHLLMLGATTVIQIFFVISGLLMFIKFQQANLIGPQTSWKKLFKTFMQILLLRYIRFLPSMALLMLFNATILTRLQNGPFWRHITEPLRVFSRNNGWRNLLLINNFSQDKTASHHTWYLAADWQLFVLYLLVIMVTAKYPKLKKYIYTSLAVLSFSVPFFINYWFKLTPSFVIKPESYRYAFFNEIDVYNKAYTQFYTYLSGYLIGIINGEIYIKYATTEGIRKIVRKPKVYLWAYLVIPIGFLICWTNAMLEFSEPSFWTALYSGIHLIIWNVFICSLPLLCMSCRCGWMAYEFCCLPIFRILGRLTYQVFIWHVTILYLINGYQRQPYYVNKLHIAIEFIFTYTVSNFVAFFTTIFVEYPIAQCTQLLNSKGTSKTAKKSS